MNKHKNAPKLAFYLYKETSVYQNDQKLLYQLVPRQAFTMNSFS